MSKDIRVSLGFLDHPKTRLLKRRLGPEGVVALIRFWCFTAQNNPRGTYENHTEEYLELAADWEGEPGAFISTAIAVGFIERTESGFKVHDWDVHNPFAFHSEDRSQKARQSAKTRWRKAEACAAHNDAMQSACESHTDRMHDACDSYAPSPSPSPSPRVSSKHSPRKKDLGGTSYPLVAAGGGDGRGGRPAPPQPPQPDEPATPENGSNGSSHGPPPCPHQAIIALYHETLPELPRVAAWSGIRQKHLAARWREAPERQDLDWWREFFRGIRQCPHLLGHNDRGWRADLPWMLKPEKFLGIIEGKYRREPRTVSEKTARTMANLDGVDLDAPAAWSRT